ncbi:MAG: hypothetical protein JSW40_00325 [Candidatus Omnitrophota bacterium]|nr:MAG: hypothetical protein JSW40_00325 [Candidatus Omnitrophota bacterium]
MRQVSRLLLFVCVGIIFVSFFLPWVNVQSKQAGQLTKLLTGKRQENIASISGFDVPVLANGEEARLIASIVEIFKPGVKNVDKKSYLVWGIPIFALFILGLTLALKENKWLNIAVGIIGCVIFIAAVYKIKTTDLDKLVLQVRIGVGLWLILWSYLGLGIRGFMQIFQPPGTNK